MPDIHFTVIAFTLGMSMFSNICINCAPTTSDEDSAIDPVDGQMLFDLGKKFNMTMWRVMGRAMKRIENEVKEQAHMICRLNPCSEWTEWSNCDFCTRNFSQIGARTRDRTCGTNTTFCKQHGVSKVVRESEVCENHCPKDYTITMHGFCVKLYSIKKQRYEAEKMCRNDGGHLVHIDSMIKVRDVNETLLRHSFPDSLFYIDGRRTVQAGPFAYGYKSVDPSFTFWGANDPDNSPTELCMIYQKDHSRGYKWRRFDYHCTSLLKFMCEIRL